MKLKAFTVRNRETHEALGLLVMTREPDPATGVSQSWLELMHIDGEEFWRSEYRGAADDGGSAYAHLMFHIGYLRRNYRLDGDST